MLTSLVISLGSASFQAKLTSFQPLGFDVEPAQGAWKVTEIQGESLGIAVGDEILLVRGERIENAERLRQLLVGGQVTDIVVKRGELLEVVPYSPPALDIDFAYLALTAISIFYLLIGLFTLFKDRQVQTRLFFFWCLTSAALYALSPPLIPATAVERLIFLVDQAARTLLPALTLHLFLTFPSSILPASWRRRVRWVYLPSLLLLAFHADEIFGRPWVFGQPTAAKLELVSRFELLFFVLCSFVAILTLGLRLSRVQDWEQRRQVQWILLGMLGGFVPFLMLYVVPYLLNLAWPAWTAVAAVAPLALIPLTFAWAILRYKLLDFGVIIRDSLSFGLTALVGLFAFSMMHMLLRSGALDQMAIGRNILTFAAGLAVAGALVPTRSVIATGLERLQYRGLFSQRRLLNDLGQELLFERDLDPLCDALIGRLEEGLIVKAALYLTQGGAMVPVHPHASLPSRLDFDAFGDDLWQRQVDSLSGVELPGSASTEQRLFAAGLRYVFPLTVRNHRVGVVLVGYKYDDQPLNSEDLDLVRQLLNQAALAIENAQLLEEVHGKLIEVMRLEERNQGILESSPAGIAVLDREHRVVSANHAFAAIAGRQRSEVEGCSMRELIPVTPLPDPEDGLMDVSYCQADGSERYLQLSLAHYEQGGQRDDLQVLIIQDTSERIALELELQEKERMAALGMLAAGVAHEVNTPLTGISSYAQMLLSDTDEEGPEHEILKKIETQTFRASQIVNNLLEFSRNRHKELSAVSLTKVLGEALHLLDERFQRSSVALDWHPPAELFSVQGSEGELHQVFTNLVVNALDAMAAQRETTSENDAGTAPRQVTVQLSATERRYRVSISDTGPGIPKGRLERIFQPFFSSKLKQGGTGLGLAICYNIVRRHGGEIVAQNHDDGPGCTFRVELPRQDTI